MSVAQLFRFLCGGTVHPGSNFRFDTVLVFMANYSFRDRRSTCQQRGAHSDFVNFMICRSSLSDMLIEGRVCVHVNRGECMRRLSNMLIETWCACMRS